MIYNLNFANRKLHKKKLITSVANKGNLKKFIETSKKISEEQELSQRVKPRANTYGLR